MATKNTEVTSKRVASKAGRLLKTSKSKATKSVAASALTQRPNKPGTKPTSPKKK